MTLAVEALKRANGGASPSPSPLPAFLRSAKLPRLLGPALSSVPRSWQHLALAAAAGGVLGLVLGRTMR